MSKIEAGGIELSQEAIDLHELLDGATRVIPGRAAKKDLHLYSNYAPNLPKALIGDHGRLHQILINLLGNSVKFTEQGHITLRASYDNGTLTVAIEDTGVGMAAEDIERIGQPFVQVGSNNTHRQQGSGLGLSIVLSLAQSMGGDLKIQSEVGLGSCFTLHLPLAEASPQQSAKAAEGTAAIRRQQPLVGFNILVVDDDRINRSITSTLLTKLNVNATVVDSGRGLEPPRGYPH